MIDRGIDSTLVLLRDARIPAIAAQLVDFEEGSVGSFGVDWDEMVEVWHEERERIVE